MTAEEIKELRKQAGLTQKAFADLLQVSENTVARWERGDRSPRDFAVKARLERLRKESTPTDETRREAK